MTPNPTPRTWRFAPRNFSESRHLRRHLGLDRLVSRILANRGYTDLDEAYAFLNPTFSQLGDTDTMIDMDRAVRRTLEAFRDGDRIRVCGDDDVDGVTSTSCVYLFFKQLGIPADFCIPLRTEGGSGINMNVIRRAARDGVQLLITTDCGVTNVEEIALARQLGMDVIVLDHHTMPEELPDAVAILNPMRPDNRYPFKRLAAVGVAFNFVRGLWKALCDYGLLSPSRIDLREYLDIVALGTVADVVPLVSENRVFVRLGLEILRRRRRPGISALLDRAHVDDQPITARTIGYRIAPLINAAGRMGDASRCVELLTTNSYKRADALSRELERDNWERQRTEREILEEAIGLAAAEFDAGRNLLMLSSHSWHQGVLGIVASRVKERFHRPAAMVAANPETGMARVSMRSIRGIDLIAALRTIEPLLESYGGHIAAAGMTLPIDNLEQARSRLEAAISAQADPMPSPILQIDAESRLADLNASFINDLEHLAPFGAGNPEPILLVRNVRARGKIINERHLRLRLREGEVAMNAIGFTLASRAEILDRPLDVALTPRLTHPWQQQRLELTVHDIRPYGANRDRARTSGLAE
ncbi:MAG: single-stranded-DNA-specific exonuclease RecJ [Myxococcales bacterium]|nr:single-stranded-DNA-specific exonuclease RecJ [Myxococcales bacterium]